MFDYDVHKRNLDRLLETMSSTVSSIMEEHLSGYHLGIDRMGNPEKEALEQQMERFVKADLSSNLSSVRLQKFISHRSETTMEGLDFVDDFQLRRSPDFPEVTRWYRHWNSGYLEQGGIILLRSSGEGFGDGMGATYAFDMNSGNVGYRDDFIEVTLPVRYDYPITFAKRFYHMEPDGIVQKDGVLDSQNRYIPRVTTIVKENRRPYQSLVDENLYQSCEIANMKNGSFWIRLDQNADGYTFYVSGFLKNRNPRKCIQLDEFLDVAE